MIGVMIVGVLLGCLSFAFGVTYGMAIERSRNRSSWHDV